MYVTPSGYRQLLKHLLDVLAVEDQFLQVGAHHGEDGFEKVHRLVVQIGGRGRARLLLVLFALLRRLLVDLHGFIVVQQQLKIRGFGFGCIRYFMWKMVVNLSPVNLHWTMRAVQQVRQHRPWFLSATTIAVWRLRAAGSKPIQPNHDDDDHWYCLVPIGSI